MNAMIPGGLVRAVPWILAAALVLARAGALAGQGAISVDPFAPFALPPGGALGDSASVARLDRDAQAAVYSAVLAKAVNAAPGVSQLLEASILPNGDHAMDYGPRADSALLRRVTTQVGMIRLCGRSLSQGCTDAYVYVLSRIYRIDANAVRVFVVHRWGEDVFRVEPHDGEWVVTAHQPMWQY